MHFGEGAAAVHLSTPLRPRGTGVIVASRTLLCHYPTKLCDPCSLQWNFHRLYRTLLPGHLKTFLSLPCVPSGPRTWLMSPLYPNCHHPMIFGICTWRMLPNGSASGWQHFSSHYALAAQSRHPYPGLVLWNGSASGTLNCDVIISDYSLLAFLLLYPFIAKISVPILLSLFPSSSTILSPHSFFSQPRGHDMSL